MRETRGGQQDLSKVHWEDPDKSLCLIVLTDMWVPLKKKNDPVKLSGETQDPEKEDDLSDV